MSPVILFKKAGIDGRAHCTLVLSQTEGVNSPCRAEGYASTRSRYDKRSSYTFSGSSGKRADSHGRRANATLPLMESL